MGEGEETPRKHSSKSRSVSVARRVERADRSKGAGLRDDDERMRAQKMADKAQADEQAREGGGGPHDYHQDAQAPVQRQAGIGKTDRR